MLRLRLLRCALAGVVAVVDIAVAAAAVIAVAVALLMSWCCSLVALRLLSCCSRADAPLLLLRC